MWQIPETVRQNEVYVQFETKEKGKGPCSFKGKEGNSQEEQQE